MAALGQMLRCRVIAGEGTDMPERSAARGGVDIDLLQGGPKVRIPSPPGESGANLIFGANPIDGVGDFARAPHFRPRQK